MSKHCKDCKWSKFEGILDRLFKAYNGMLCTSWSKILVPTSLGSNYEERMCIMERSAVGYCKPEAIGFDPKSIPAEPPICKDCRHYLPAEELPGPGNAEERCAASRSEHRNLVSGNITVYYGSCWMLRSPGKECGPKGVLFTPKEISDDKSM